MKQPMAGTMEETFGLWRCDELELGILETACLLLSFQAPLNDNSFLKLIWSYCREDRPNTYISLP